ncbi:hypothetical protein AB9R83_11255 [Oceanimonas smirnovii]|uniref:hypothetical protein n=1 Tax=Oceanimonas smirnovii TaxID=264574 RepID=UPI003AB09BA2
MFLICSDDCSEKDILEGVAYHNAGLIFYTSGLDSFKENGGLCEDLQEGRFFIKYSDGNEIVLRADREGNELVFYYAVDDFWCVSTSFLGLVIFLQKKGCYLTASKLEIAKMFINTSFFEQPYNNNLPVKEVKFLNAEEEIRIVDGTLTVMPRREAFSSRVNNDRFIERVSSFIKESRRFILSLAEGFNVDLELSGGVDSRLMLGLSLPCKDRLNVSSNKARKNDYIIASALSKSFGLKLNEVRINNSGSTDFSVKWMLYKLANVGISRTNPLPNGASGTRFSNTVRLNGGGGGNVKVFYNTNVAAYFNLIDRSILNEEMKVRVKEDVKLTLSEFGYYEKPNQAMVDVYSKYRQRFFAGRAWYYALTGIVYAPLASKSYKSLLLAEDVEMFFGLKKEEILNRNLIALLILYLLDPVLTLAQFDEEKKNFSLADIRLVQDLVRDQDVKFVDDYKPSKIYGCVSSSKVLPSWIEFDSIDGYDNDYESLISKDLRGVLKSLRKLNIMNEVKFLALEEKFASNDLGKNERLALLHVAEILKWTNAVL